jgi:hypothetical protein
MSVRGSDCSSIGGRRTPTQVTAQPSPSHSLP